CHATTCPPTRRQISVPGIKKKPSPAPAHASIAPAGVVSSGSEAAPRESMGLNRQTKTNKAVLEYLGRENIDLPTPCGWRNSVRKSSGYRRIRYAGVLRILQVRVNVR